MLPSRARGLRAYNSGMALIEVYSPIAATETVEHALAPRPEAFAGRRIAWFDNRKANAAALLGHVAAAFAGGLDSAQQSTTSKDATAAAPDTIMAHLETCDAVVLAIAD